MDNSVMSRFWIEISKAKSIGDFANLCEDYNSYKLTEEESFEIAKKECQEKNAEYGELKGYKCEKCRNKGKIAYVEKVELNAGTRYYSAYKDCECLQIRKLIERIENSGVSAKIEANMLEKYETSEGWQKLIKSKAIKFINDKNAKMFFIGGQSGCGKTHICSAILIELIKRGMYGTYISWIDEIQKLKRNATDDERYNTIMSKLKNTKVLYIDDFLKPVKTKTGESIAATEADIRIAYAIINHRISNPDLITIISSECYIMEIMDIDEATGGRIAEKATAEYLLNIKRDKTKNYRRKNIDFL